MSMSIDAPTEKKLMMSLDDLINSEKTENHKNNNNPRKANNWKKRHDDSVGRGSDGRVTLKSAGDIKKSRPYDSEKSQNFKKAFNVRNWKGRCIKVSNVPFDLTWKDLKSAFSVCGEIERVDIEEKGTAWITYEDSRDAENAVRTYDGGDVNGRIIKVKLV
jgi:RNA recognition motif-containing protein